MGWYLTDKGLKKTNKYSEKRIPNSAFHFSARHPLLWDTMKSAVQAFTGTIRSEIGPKLLTEAILKR